MIKNKENLRVFALGGLNEVGKNCYVLEKKNDIIIIDAGIKFLNSNYNLANAIIPNFEYIKKNKDKVKAIFISHGHEDHIGAMPYLLEILPNVPVYGSDFSLAILKQKMRNGFKLISSSFSDDTVISTSEFKVSFFRVTHSIPGSFGLIVEVIEDESRIILTGDFKFDWTEIGEKTDIAKLAECGRKGVDLLLSDSTNSEVKGTTPSEIKVINRLENLIFQSPGRVIITSFASNVYRLKKVIEIAKKYNKRIALLGSSLSKMMEAIKKASLWKIDSSVFIDVESIKTFPKEKLIIFCTGSQGEERAVLSRLANQTYSDLKIIEGDSIILTSSPIMDNRYNLEIINNKLYELGATIYENNKEDLLHASGHASQEDLKLMLTLVNPKHFMPFHGDYRMLKTHGFLAEEIGIPKKNIFICENGEVVSSQKNKDGNNSFFVKNEKIFTKPDYIFNQKVISGEIWDSSVELRKEMYEAGVIIILIFISKKGKNKFVNFPHIFTYGFINIQKNKDLIRKWKEEILLMLNKLENYDEKNMKKEITSSIKEIFKRDWKGKEPVILPIIERES
ncbi:MAG: Ribonuclease J 1 [Mycoplasmataceae bacterium]|nr:MAG: Ribonuclease J 1 [Mycoplasmataceae bacterium]